MSVVWLLTFFAVTYAAAGPDTCSSNNGLLAEIPFRLHGHMIIAEFSVDGSAPLSFIFDTGAGGTVISAKTASKLGIAGKEVVSREGATGASRVVRSENHVVTAGNLRLRDITLGIADLGHIDRRLGMSVDGIIGWPILSQYAVRFNYDAMRMEIYDAEKPYSGADGKDCDIEVKGTAIFTNATVVLRSGESFTGKVMVDTGSGGAITFNMPFAEENDLLARVGRSYVQEIQGFGTETSRVYVTRLQSLAIGEYKLEGIPASIATAERGAFSWRIMGILGNAILKRFNMLIDLKKKKVFLEPNQLYAEEFEVNCSGLELVLDDTLQKVIIDHVHAESPAQEAGLKAGDEIVRIDGANASLLPLPQIRSLLSQAGKEIGIAVDRKGELHSFQLKLRPLIE